MLHHIGQRFSDHETGAGLDLGGRGRAMSAELDYRCGATITRYG
jgi:hypothetical protein